MLQARSAVTGVSTRWSVLRLVGIAAFVALSAWFLSPSLSSTHVEAFSARLQSQAILRESGELGLDDQIYPVNTEFLYTSRPGTVHAVEWMMRLTRTSADFNFRLVILISYLVFVGSCLAFVQRWSKGHLWLALAFLILTPGLVEISFFFADNLPSAALASLALALVGRQTRLWIWPLVGVLSAMSVLLRLDAVFAFPAIVVVASLQDNLQWKRLAGEVLLASAGMAAVFYVSWRLTTVSLGRAFTIASWFAHMHVNAYGLMKPTVHALALFFGLTSLLLLAAGAWKNIRTNSLRWNLCLTVYPALLYLFLMPRAFEERDFLLLGGPFLLLQGATGMSHLLSLARGAEPTKRFSVYTAVLICLLSLLLPPYIIMQDGPRTAIGRFWSPLLWKEWQGSIVQGLNECDALIDSAKPGERVLVVSSMWNSDRYFHLRLLQRGYSLQPLSLDKPYSGMTEIYQKEGRKFVHVRTEAPYGILASPPTSLPTSYTQDFQLAAALNSISPSDFDRAFLLAWGEEKDQSFLASTAPFQRSAGPMELRLPAKSTTPALRRGNYGELRVISLSKEDVFQLRTFALAQVAEAEATNDGTWRPIRNYEEFHKLVSSRFWTP